MIVLQGNGISPGLVQGTLYFEDQGTVAAESYEVDDLAEEQARLNLACRQSVCQLEALAEECKADEMKKEASAVFEIQALLVTDELFMEYVEHCLQEKRCNAEHAVHEAGERFAVLLSALDDAYMSARAGDIRDVADRICRNLRGIQEIAVNPADPVILAARDLAPSRFIRLDRSKIQGLVLAEGSPNGHTAILARAMGIPAVFGAGQTLNAGCHGKEAVLDGKKGILYIEPDRQTRENLCAEKQLLQEQRRGLEAVKGLEDVTKKGRRLDICCNINLPEETEAVLSNDGHGIGLFRTEFLYLKEAGEPDEEEQFQAYKKVAEAMAGRRVVFRTLDIGADKLQEEALDCGMRGVRFCLTHPELFRTQLRALYRASVYGNTAVLFPMITSLWEITECKRMCEEVMEELEKAGVPYNRKMELGIMIETPAAVFLADELAEEVDFFSVGTNDLTQYILGCDRQTDTADFVYDPRHPAVQRAIRTAAEAADRAGIRIGICGELGADREMLPVFLEMGIHEVSVVPDAVLPLRATLRDLE